MVGETISHFRIDENLGEGGMGVVYRAVDLRLDRVVALKFLPSHLVADEVARERFLVEAKAASALDHPNICAIHQIDTTETGELFIAMGYYAGTTLAEMIEEGPLSGPEVVDLMTQVAKGLSRAHEQGIVHRDIKPANLIRTKDGTWKILDFGVAKLAGASRLTRTGAATGTIAYMAPEQAERNEASPQSDLWALGVVGYEALTGQLPFEGATPVATLYQILHQDPPPVGKVLPQTPQGLADAISYSLAKEPANRPSGMQSLLDLLDRSDGVGFDAGVSVPGFARASPLEVPGPFSPPALSTVSGSRVEKAPPFIGREQELTVLSGWLGDALQERGRVGFISGEPGVGKTSLARQFCEQTTEREAEVVVATGECNAHTGSGDPLHPFCEILSQLTGDVEAQWAGGSLSANQATRLWGILPDAIQALAEEGPGLIGPFLSASSLMSRANEHPLVRPADLASIQGFARESFSGIRPADVMDQVIRVLLALARKRPLILVIDDLQWADPGTLDLLLVLGRRISHSRIVLLGLYRPAEIALGRDGRIHPLEPVLQEVAIRYGDVLVEVGKERGQEFMESLVDSEPNKLSDSFRRSLFTHTQGNALFTVELLQAMKEEGDLTKSASGEWMEGEAINWERLPTRVDAVIRRLVGRLPEELRQLLAISSVEGLEFTLEAVAEVQGVGIRDLLAPFSQILEKRHRIVSSHGIQTRDGNRITRYRFRHALFQKFLYDSLSEVERIHRHDQIGQALETLYGEERGELAVTLAYHFEAAQRPDRALEYLETAGFGARSAGAFVEAVGHLEGALEALATLPQGPARDRREIDLQIDLANVRIFTGLPDYESASQRALDLARKEGSKQQLFWSLLQAYYSLAEYSGKTALGKTIAEEALGIGRELGDDQLVSHGLFLSSVAAYHRGDFQLSLGFLQETASLYRPDEHRDERFSAIQDIWPSIPGTIGLLRWMLGYPDRGLRDSLEGVSRAEHIRSPSSLLMMEMFLGYAFVWRREPKKAFQVIGRMLDRAEDVGMKPFYGLWVQTPLGLSMAMEGDLDVGIEQMRLGLQNWRSVGWWFLLPSQAASLAKGLLMAGEAEEGLEILQDIHTQCEDLGGLIHEAEVQRTFGDLFLGLPTPDPEAAETSYRKGVEVARLQEARSYELRATTSLARLLRDTGRVAEGREMLANIYGWFTEGFETPDLIEAKALLNGLS